MLITDQVGYENPTWFVFDSIIEILQSWNLHGKFHKCQNRHFTTWQIEAIELSQAWKFFFYRGGQVLRNRVSGWVSMTENGQKSQTLTPPNPPKVPHVTHFSLHHSIEDRCPYMHMVGFQNKTIIVEVIREKRFSHVLR